MNLLEQFKKENSQLLNTERVYLVAVSGGSDSMTLLDLCIKCKLKIAIAHCNFMLRNKESMRDENFVKTFAEKNAIPLFCERFDTKKISAEQKLSIQETARNLRYNFFNELIIVHNFQCVFTAHNQNDNVETLFINLLRGTGINGLKGISKKRNQILRPLLFAHKQQIIEHIVTNKIQFVEDSSNNSDYYLRNNIRHHIIPEFEKIDINAVEKMYKSLAKITSDIALQKYFIDDWILKNATSFNENETVISIEKLDTLPTAFPIIKTICKGANISDLEINKLLQANTGAIYQVENYFILKNRNNVIIKSENYLEQIASEIILENDKKSNSFLLQNIDADDYKIENNIHAAQLDFNKLEFPLIHRKWQQGDYFYPHGMRSKKSVSNVLKDRKVSLFDREKVTVLISDNKIAWLVGIRIDARFAITENTKCVYKVSLKFENAK